MTIELLLVAILAAGLFLLLEITTGRVAANASKPRPVPVRISSETEKRGR